MVTQEEKPAIMKKIKQLLMATSFPDKKITSGEIAKEVDVKPGKSNVTIRNLITETIYHYKLPVEGTSRGYVMINSEEQLLGYLESLESRIQEIEKRKAEITSYFYHGYKENEVEIDENQSEEDVEEIPDQKEKVDWKLIELFG